MRNIVLASIFVLPIFCSAQSWNYTNTNSRYPIIGEFIYSGGIDYQGNTVLPHFRLRNTSGSAIVNQFWAKDSNGDLKWFNIGFNAENKTLGFGGQQQDASIHFNHNVGIGTSDPIDKLTVNGGDMTIGKTDNHEYNIWFRPSDNNPRSSVIGYSSNIVANDYIGMQTKWGSIRFYTNDKNEVLRITDSERVGIGTTNPDSKLTVAGNIHSREVKVTVDAGADFVFDESYQLRTLEETEKFISKNKHLPEIASANEMLENGLQIGEMNIKLLQKIEELTLYLIEQNKQNQAQQAEIQELREEIKLLKNN